MRFVPLVLVLLLAVFAVCSLQQRDVPVPATGVGLTQPGVQPVVEATEGAVVRRDGRDAKDSSRQEVAPPETGFRVRVADQGAVAGAFGVAAWKHLKDGKWSKVAVGTSGEAGTALLAVAPGRYRISFDAPGVVRTPLKQAYAVRESELRDITVRLPKPCAVVGRVVDPDGKPLSGVAITLPQLVDGEFAKGGNSWRVLSDLSGGFSISRLAPGHTSMRLVHPDFVAHRSGTGDLLAGHTVDLGDVQLSKGLRLRGRVLDQDAEPLPGATVQVMSSKRVATTDQLGRFEIDRVPDNATLYVQQDGFLGQGVVVGRPYGWGQVKWPDTSRPLDIKLDRGFRIVGSVTSARHPVKVSIFNYRKNSCWREEPEVDAEGRFRTRTLSAGRTEIQAYAPGLGYSELLEIDLQSDLQEVALSIQPTRSVAIKVVDDLDAPVANADVTIEGYSDNDVFRCIFGTRENVTTKQASRTGDVVFDGVFDGTWTIKVAARGHSPNEIKVELAPGIDDLLVRLKRVGQLEVLVSGAPPELAEQLRIYCEPTSAGGAKRQFRLRDAALGVDMLPGNYELTFGPWGCAKAMLGKRADSMPGETVQLQAGKTTRCELEYRGMPRVRGKLLLPAYVKGPVRVYAMRPDTWRERCSSAHFLGFNLDLYAARADCDPEGRFEYHLAEHGPWLFVAKFETSPVPLLLGTLELTGAATPTFRVPGAMVRGRLHPDFRGEDGKWPRLMCVPDFLSSHDPFYDVGGIDMMPSKNQFQIFSVQPDSSGEFLFGPLEPKRWTLTLRTNQQLVGARELQVGVEPIELGVLPVPKSGPLEVTVRNATKRSAAVLRMIGTGGEKDSAYLAAATCKDGVLRFGPVPFGDYRLELMRGSSWSSTSTGVSVVVHHGATGVEPASVTFPEK